MFSNKENGFDNNLSNGDKIGKKDGGSVGPD